MKKNTQIKILIYLWIAFVLIIGLLNSISRSYFGAEFIVNIGAGIAAGISLSLPVFVTLAIYIKFQNSNTKTLDLSSVPTNIDPEALKSTNKKGFLIFFFSIYLLFSIIFSLAGEAEAWMVLGTIFCLPFGAFFSVRIILKEFKKMPKIQQANPIKIHVKVLQIDHPVTGVADTIPKAIAKIEGANIKLQGDTLFKINTRINLSLPARSYGEKIEIKLKKIFPESTLIEFSSRYKFMDDTDGSHSRNLKNIYHFVNYLHEVFPNKVHESHETFKKERFDIMENLDRYLEYTKTNSWDLICKINNVKLDSFGTEKELAALPNYLEEGEIVFALTSGLMNQTETSNSSDYGSNTWLVVLTSERFLFIDCAWVSNSIDTQSIRHDRVLAISASQGLVFGAIMIDIGNRMINIDNCVKETVSIIADLANKWLSVLSKNHDPKKPAHSSSFENLEKLSDLHAKGVITDEEFKAAKEKILSTI